MVWVSGTVSSGRILVLLCRQEYQRYILGALPNGRELETKRTSQTLEALKTVIGL